MRFLAAAVLALLLPQAALACGPDTDCRIGERTYRIELPPGSNGATGALIFAHGYKGSSKGTMRNKGLRAMAHDMGLAFVAADAGDDIDWMIPNRPRHRDNDGSRELAYFDALAEDLVTRHGLNRDDFIVTGFSAGGMMTWELACKRGDRFRAFIPIAGTFWAPVPPTCPNPPRDLVHIHGTSDKIVPLEGRPIADTFQGDVFEALDLLQRTGPFQGPRAFDVGDLGCEGRDGGDRTIIFCTHPGGHSIKSKWLRTALELIRREPVK